jgi:hypothetical protein
VLADDREQVAEQLSLLVCEPLGDLVDRRGRAVRDLGADPRVAAPIERHLVWRRPL